MLVSLTQLELIAGVATADDMETVVTVHYEQATKAPSPNAAVKAVGFAQLPQKTPGAAPSITGPGGRSDRLAPITRNNIVTIITEAMTMEAMTMRTARAAVPQDQLNWRWDRRSNRRPRLVRCQR